MTPSPSPTSNIQALAQQNLSPVGATTPHWWCGSQEHFDSLLDTRRSIHQHDKAVATRARLVMTATVVSAISIYSVDAMGAFSVPVGAGLLLTLGTLLVAAACAWLVDRRLVQQLGDLELRSRLWLDLVEAVRGGSVDTGVLHLAHQAESEIESFLRKEAAVAAEFLDSHARRAPHLPIFGNCFTLENV